MRKILFAISIVFLSCTLIVHGVLAYEFNMVQTLPAEEETSHEDTGHKSSKEKDSKEKYVFLYQYRSNVTTTLANLALANSQFCFSKGFADKPYMPPEVI